MVDGDGRPPNLPDRVVAWLAEAQGILKAIDTEAESHKRALDDLDLLRVQVDGAIQRMQVEIQKEKEN